jgi:hypothetical protein
MPNETFELLLGEDGELHKGQPGGIQEVLNRLDIINAKLDVLLENTGSVEGLNTKFPEAQSS